MSDPIIETHPVQTSDSPQRVPKVVTMRAYEAYCEVFSPQEAMVTGWCRGGFGTGELIALLYARSFPKDEWDIRFHEALKGMERVKAIASGRTCVSFENFCWGASSLWHQIHRNNFRKVDRKPEELSRFVLEECNSVNDDFPKQVLELLQLMKKEIVESKQANAKLVNDKERLEGLQRLAKDHVVKFAIFENGKLDLALAKESGEILAYHGHPDLRQAIDAAITKGTV